MPGVPGAEAGHLASQGLGDRQGPFGAVEVVAQAPRLRQVRPGTHPQPVGDGRTAGSLVQTLGDRQRQLRGLQRQARLAGCRLAAAAEQHLADRGREASWPRQQRGAGGRRAGQQLRRHMRGLLPLLLDAPPGVGQLGEPLREIAGGRRYRRQVPGFPGSPGAPGLQDPEGTFLRAGRASLALRGRRRARRLGREGVGRLARRVGQRPEPAGHRDAPRAAGDQVTDDPAPLGRLRLVAHEPLEESRMRMVAGVGLVRHRRGPPGDGNTNATRSCAAESGRLSNTCCRRQQLYSSPISLSSNKELSAENLDIDLSY